MPASADRPLLLLDCDGVLNSLDSAATTETHEHRTLHGYRLRISRELLAAVPELDATYEVLWLSTWRAETRDVAAAFGLPDWPYVDFPQQTLGESSITTKFPVAAELITAARDQGRRCVWADDELGEEHHEWARLLVSPSLLLVQTNEAQGLRPDLVEKMLDFAARRPVSWPVVTS